ncbi:3-hydroxyacyl-CoA dehydrogenase NAD-binding domain-containing protein [Chitinophaga horti]|uniref:3-hydroxyacyl-CoA dehydrogenase NAD-binding domain-containing protein n=1 Tax=Chitinophaga horti TaxID=2920382 RepID=A0ABY6IZE5_9BACT|nr:3-hydroxyacyl-CoA dehydrogenase NAD-binding domain-containing protein [Chitinophaga horti]UYQ92745.1 3-hydroxyacyl-CoA dehydrogenase NAD-binding domain-containing protein [Chitinophaga horti]
MLTVHEINSIAVCGAGTMGAGIAQVTASAGFYTILFDLKPDILDKARAQIQKSLQQQVEKGRLAQPDADAALGRIRFTTDAHDCIAEVIIEAIVEKVAAKAALFNQLAELNHSEAVFASNTSSLSLSTIAKAIQHPSRVAGLHFFNPAPAMKLVEVVSGEQTAAWVSELLYQLAQQLGKTPVRVKDAPGFIVNRVARHFYLEAMQLAGNNNTSFKTIDTLLEAVGFRMGPFALMDLIGNDINLAVSTSLYEAFDKAPRFEPGKLQQHLVAEGNLGRKTGKGFYNYNK